MMADEVWFKRLTIAVAIVGVLVAILGVLVAYYGTGVRESAVTLESSAATLADIRDTMREMRKESREDFKELRAEIAVERAARAAEMREFRNQLLLVARQTSQRDPEFNTNMIGSAIEVPAAVSAPVPLPLSED